MQRRTTTKICLIQTHTGKEIRLEPDNLSSECRTIEQRKCTKFCFVANKYNYLRHTCINSRPIVRWGEQNELRSFLTRESHRGCRSKRRPLGVFCLRWKLKWLGIFPGERSRKPGVTYSSFTCTIQPCLSRYLMSRIFPIEEATCNAVRPSIFWALIFTPCELRNI